MRDDAVRIEKPFTFRAWQAKPIVMPGPHAHTDIELNLLLSGEATYFLAGRFHAILPDQMAVFWAGMPHRLTRVASQTEYFCMTLPLAWFLAWEIDTAFSQRLLAGDMILETDAVQSTLDKIQFSRWVVDTQSVRPEGQCIALLEVEARLRRLALSSALAMPLLSSTRRGGNEGRGQQMEQIASFVGRHYAEELTAQSIAASVGLHPNYAMTVFKEGCGLSLWEYVTRLRVSHAQRLLMTTDWTVERIALDCGFGSPSRFFAAFKRLCGTTPRQYREGRR